MDSPSRCWEIENIENNVKSKAQAQAHSSIEGDLMNGLFRLFHEIVYFVSSKLNFHFNRYTHCCLHILFTCEACRSNSNITNVKGLCQIEEKYEKQRVHIVSIDWPNDDYVGSLR